jgi:acyl-CoA synthetase (AMP-forming)/AMP-acid ligase II
MAYVSLRPEVDVADGDLAAVCERELAKYKRPVAIEVLEELPKNAVGKIDKPALRARAQD